MKKYLAGIIFFTSIAFASEGYYQIGQVTTDFDQLRAFSSVVSIVSSNTSATGFLISNSGHGLTNLHVLRRCISEMLEKDIFNWKTGFEGKYYCDLYKVKIPHFTEFSLEPSVKRTEGIYILAVPPQKGSSKKILKGSGVPKNDFVLFQIFDSVDTVFSIKRTIDLKQDKGERLYSIGYPGRSQRERTFKKLIGEFGPYKDADTDPRLMIGYLNPTKTKYDAAITENEFLTDIDGTEGVSGSPVFDKDLNLAGITFAQGSYDPKCNSGEHWCNEKAAHISIIAIRNIFKKVFLKLNL